MDKISSFYADVSSGKPCRNPSVRGAFGEATILLKQTYRRQSHRDFQMKGEREEAMDKILQEFIKRGWIEPCLSDAPPPPFSRCEEGGRGIKGCCGLP